PVMLFGSAFADYRLPCGAAFFALASLQLRPQTRTRALAAAIALSILLLARIGTILSDWAPAHPILAEYEDVFAPVPPGGRILVLEPSADHSIPLDHLPVFAAAKRELFVPYTFTEASVPLRLKSEYRSY